MSSLPDTGVVGVGMFPRGFAIRLASTRRWGVRRATRVASCAPRRRESSAMYAALGATTTDDEPNPGAQVGTDSSFLLNPAGTASGNVTFYPKVNVLVADADVWDTLSAAQRTVLTKAAANTLDWTDDNIPKEADAARACYKEAARSERRPPIRSRPSKPRQRRWRRRSPLGQGTPRSSTRSWPSGPRLPIPCPWSLATTTGQ